MEIKMKVYGEMNYTADGEEDGREVKGYEEIEIPLNIEKEAIIYVLEMQYGCLGPYKLDCLFDGLGIWDTVIEAAEEKYEDEIKDFVKECYTLYDLKAKQ